MDSNNVVLIGGGHAHLYLLPRARQYLRAGARLSLIDPGAFWYSGMASGLVSGRYRPTKDRIDLQALADHFGVTLYRSRAVSVDRKHRSVQLQTGENVDYDLLSLNLGSHCGPLPYPPTDGDIPVKPIKGLLRLRSRVLAEQPARVAVIGGGATGCELACNLRELVTQNGQDTAIHLFMRESLPLPGLPERARRAVSEYLQDIGIMVHASRAVDDLQGDTLFCSGTSQGQFQLRTIATGLQANTIDMVPAMRFNEVHGFAINDELQTEDQHIFAAGDCSDFSTRTLPKIGVYGVRQAPVLHHNLLAMLKNKKLKAYCPQQQYLSIINLGYGRALACRGRIWKMGPAIMSCKNWLDQRFMRKYQR